MSLYVTSTSRLSQLQRLRDPHRTRAVVANLRHDKLDGVITEAVADRRTRRPTIRSRLNSHSPSGWRSQLKARREEVRGKPETFNRPDYNFRLERQRRAPSRAATRRVQITPRLRGAPLDLIVAEAMILANSHWGGWLADRGVPGIYRSQASLAPGVKVRMGTKAAPHAGMGVAQYTWATSPLRRYVDLVNQWQIIACARHGRTAALAAPFKPKDAALFSIISAFDAAYTAYNGFQQGIERYWTLRWLEQNGIARARRPRDEERPGARRRAAAGVPRARAPRACRAARACAVRSRALDLLTLEVHASAGCAPRRRPGAGDAAEDRSRRRRSRDRRR